MPGPAGSACRGPGLGVATPPVPLGVPPRLGAIGPQRRRSRNSPQPHRAPRTGGRATQLPRGAHPYPCRASRSFRSSLASSRGSFSAARSAPGIRARSSRRQRLRRGPDGRRDPLYGASSGAAWQPPGSGGPPHGRGSAAHAPGRCPGSGFPTCCGGSQRRTPRIHLVETSHRWPTLEAASSSTPKYGRCGLDLILGRRSVPHPRSECCGRLLPCCANQLNWRSARTADSSFP